MYTNWKNISEPEILHILEKKPRNLQLPIGKHSHQFKMLTTSLVWNERSVYIVICEGKRAWCTYIKWILFADDIVYSLTE